MFNTQTNPPESRVPVEWHDCRWQPAILAPARAVVCRRKATKPLLPRRLLPHPARLKNFSMKKNPSVRRRAAFTLVELLVVIAIIGILASLLLPVLVAAKKRALVVRARTEEADLVNAINAYDTDYGRFPVTKAEQSVAAGNDFTTGLVQYPQNNSLMWPTGSGGIYSDYNSNTVAILMDLQTYANGNQTCDYGHVYNPKQVKYLNAKPSGYDPTTGALNPPGGVDNTGVYRDPWGNPYLITMNTSYSMDGATANGQGQGTSDLIYSLQVVSQSSGAAGFNGLANATDANGNGNHFLYHGKVMVWSAGPDGKIDNTVNASSGYNKDNVLSWQ